MYKCLDCGNEDKFYGVVREQGNALIFQNTKSGTGPAPEKQFASPEIGYPFPVAESGDTVRGNLWAIQNNGNSDKVTWAYFTSEGSWRGFHEVRACAVCYSTDITSI